MRLILGSELKALIRECQRRFQLHHSPVNHCKHCGTGPDLDERVDNLYHDEAVRDTLAKELHLISIWQNYEG